MSEVLKKMNYKNQKEIYVINNPISFEYELNLLDSSIKIVKSIDDNSEIEFVIGFAIKQKELDDLVELVSPRLKGDAIFWIVYPKSTSKNYKCEFNRDTGWEKLGKFNLEGVRQVAVDNDWSALRFRNVDYIKIMKRKFSANSEKGKIKTRL